MYEDLYLSKQYILCGPPKPSASELEDKNHTYDAYPDVLIVTSGLDI